MLGKKEWNVQIEEELGRQNEGKKKVRERERKRERERES